MPTAAAGPPIGVAERDHSVMRWGAIFAGWFVATGTAMLLYEFGLAVGFSAFDPRNVVAATRGLSGGTIAWAILIWGAALWMGGMFASWFDGRNDTEMGVVRGVTVWGLSLTVTGLLVASGLTHTVPVGSIVGTNAPMVTQEQLAHYTAALMWTAFGSSVLSLLTSAFGGWLGAHHVHHVYHLREYSVHGRDR